MNTQVPLLGFDLQGNWLGMDSVTLRDFADSFIDVDNFVSEEAIVCLLYTSDAADDVAGV